MDLSVIAMMGIILLIGIVKKNGIMPVDFALQVERSEGLGLEDSIYRACIMRFRPILTTTMAGLALAQVLTLYTIPVVFLYLDHQTVTSAAANEEGQPGADGIRKPGSGVEEHRPVDPVRQMRWSSGPFEERTTRMHFFGSWSLGSHRHGACRLLGCSNLVWPPSESYRLAQWWPPT